MSLGERCVYLGPDNITMPKRQSKWTPEEIEQDWARRVEKLRQEERLPSFEDVRDTFREIVEDEMRKERAARRRKRK